MGRQALLPQNATADGEPLHRYEGALRRFFSRRTGRPEDVDDLVQEAFARLLLAQQNREVDHPPAYLFRIAGNLLADRARSQRQPLTSARPLEDADHPIVGPEQEHARHAADLRSRLEAALAELPPKRREVFVLRRWHELSTEAVARRLNITPRMVQKHLAHALSHLHLRLYGDS